MQSSPSRDAELRRSRVPCEVCGRPVELIRMRDHLRSEHQVGSAELETMYLGARIQARKSHRTQR